MIEDKGLLNIVHRLIVDDDFRKRFVTIPKETLMAEVGVSEEAYRALVTIVPVLLAGGMSVLTSAASPDPGVPNGLDAPIWGRW